MTNVEECLTVTEAAEYLKITPQYVRKLIKEGKLSALQKGKQWLISNNAISEYLRNNNIIVEPDDHARKSSSVPPIVALSFFSGAMGLDIGMEKGGIPAILACEFDKYCRMTIEKNRPDMALIGDINNYTPEKILEMANLPKGQHVDVIFGGPPCQAFSTAGSQRAFDDKRGNVFLKYLDVVDAIKPTYVIIENVRGLLSTAYYYNNSTKPIKGGALLIILDKLKEMGYNVSFNLYNAANYGAPQIRERVVLIGKYHSDKKVSYLQPTSYKEPMLGLKPWKTLGDAVSDIESHPQHHIDFPEKRLRFYRLLKAGQYWKDLPPELQEEAMGAKLKLGGGKTGFFRRVSFDKPSPTLVTNPAMPATDLCHPTENRPLSVEEYARIQEFPDDWHICGPILEQYKQIGNAVPIKLGEAIAKTILADMNNEPTKLYDNFPYSRYKNTSDVTWTAHMQKVLQTAN